VAADTVDAAANGPASQVALSEFQLSLIATANAVDPTAGGPGGGQPAVPAGEHDGALLVRRSMTRILLTP
jgi:hypothetical protein